MSWSLQHEYGLYAGKDGDSVIDLLDAVEAPTIVVAHTVLRSPTPHQRAVLEEVAGAADAVVVMTEAGRRLLVGGFDVDATKVVVIPHGAAVTGHTEARSDASSRKILTWGLLGPGKGIEWAVDALALLDDLRPRATYRVAGDTHPKVAAAKGEAYRDMLRRRAADLGLAEDVSFDAGYRGLDALAELISTASVVVLPYDSPDQVTSGVLVDAVAAGRPVVATAFPHAVELLESGAGIVVPRRDPAALATALRRVLTEPGLAEGMAREARRLAPELAWPAVASRYAALGDSLLERQSVLGMTACGPTFAHLDSLTDRFGTFEHARYARARPEHGYCTDDVARVLVVTLREPDPPPLVDALTRERVPVRRGGAGRDRQHPEPARRERPLARPQNRRGLLGPEPLGFRCDGRATFGLARGRRTRVLRTRRRRGGRRGHVRWPTPPSAPPPSSRCTHTTRARRRSCRTPPI